MGDVLQEVGRAVLCAERALRRAVDDDALEIRDRLGRVAGRLHGPWRIGVKYIVDIAGDILELDIGDRKGADVTTGTGEGHPRRRCVLAGQVKHSRCPVGQYIRPIGEGTRETGDPSLLVEQAEVVTDRDAEFVAVYAGQRRQNIDRGMRDQRRVMVREQRAVVLEKVQQIRDLLKIGRHVRVIAPKVDVVELDVDDVLDTVVSL
jgi:hypothetical protein